MPSCMQHTTLSLHDGNRGSGGPLTIKPFVLVSAEPYFNNKNEYFNIKPLSCANHPQHFNAQGDLFFTIAPGRGVIW